MNIAKETKWHLLRCCHENRFVADPEITSFCLIEGPSTPTNLMKRVKQYGSDVCSKPDPRSHQQGLKMWIFGYWQNATAAKSVSLTKTLWVCFFCDVQFWYRVWRTLLQYFQIFFHFIGTLRQARRCCRTFSWGLLIEKLSLCYWVDTLHIRGKKGVDLNSYKHFMLNLLITFHLNR